MYYFLFFLLFSLNMIFFGIFNIPLFKYFCDLPIFNNNDLLISTMSFKNYYLDSINIINHYNNYIISIEPFINSFNFTFLEPNELFFNFCYFFNNFLYNFYIIQYDYIEVIFQTNVSNYNFVEFSTLQKFIYIMPNETHLIFFRMYNTVGFDVNGISIYLLYPTDFLVFFNKIQCFCFEEIFLLPYESVDLPVIFFISKEILNYLDFFYSNKLYLSYLFLIK